MGRKKMQLERKHNLLLQRLYSKCSSKHHLPDKKDTIYVVGALISPS
jgi:hypothetical protein